MKLENCQFPNRKTITGKGSLPYPVGSTPAACKTRQDKTPRGQIKMAKCKAGSMHYARPRCKAKCKVKARPRRGAHPPIFTLLLYKCPSRLQAPCSCEEAEVLPAIVYDSTIRMAGLNYDSTTVLNDSEDFSTGICKSLSFRSLPPSFPPCLLVWVHRSTGFNVRNPSLSACVCAE